jgi:hypothetical protein
MLQPYWNQAFFIYRKAMVSMTETQEADPAQTPDDQEPVSPDDAEVIDEDLF